MTNYGSSLSRLAIVLGCGDIGSAVALALHRAGFAVTLVDEADPAWHRRGMAFTNAWYLGNAELEGEGACFCASLKSVPSILARRMIAATTWSWPGVAAAFDPALLVDARGRKRRGHDSMRGRVPFTIGVGSDLADLELVDVAIPTSDAAPGPAKIEARRHGRFMTDRRIGDTVRMGEVVGGLGNEAVEAPARGVLLGLAARGARIEPGDIVVEVDSTRAEHECYGITDEARHAALRVLEAFEARDGSSSCCNTASSESRDSAVHEEYPQCTNI